MTMSIKFALTFIVIFALVIYVMWAMCQAASLQPPTPFDDEELLDDEEERLP